jgi:hypothetical protein
MADEVGQATTEAAPPADAGTTASLPTQGATTTAPGTGAGQVAPNTAGTTDEIVFPAEAQKEIGRLTKALQSQGKEIKRLKEQTPASTTQTPTFPKGDLRNHELLQGLEWDTDANGNDMVEIDDMLYSPRRALTIMQQQQAIDRLSGVTDNISQEREAAAEAKQYEGIASETYDVIEEMLPTVFPHATKEDLALLQDAVYERTAMSVQRARAEGQDLTADLISEATRDAIAHQRRLASIGGDAQLRANATAAAQQPVGSGGVVPMPGPAEYTKMTEEQKRDHGRAMVERILAKHS